MASRLTSITRLGVYVALACGVLATLGTNVPNALAVTARGNLSVTVVPDTTRSTATYTIGGFRTGNNESVTGYTLTFPVDTDATGASSPDPADDVQVAGDGRTVTVTLGSAIGVRTTFDIVLGGIVNPSTPGTYAIAEVTFHRPQGDEVVALGTNGQYAITAAPYVSMTITTPDPGQSMEFGSVDPGIASETKTVTIEVASSAPYTVSRTVSGDYIALGLAVNGDPNVNGTLGTGLAGTATFADDFTLTPPWTTDPGVPLAATITYTVTQ